jgi:Tfp pilus assembly protein PilX
MTRGTAGPRCGNPAGGERGFILPLVLLGLVAVTIMLMASLLTSSAEVAISGAQQDATTSLYEQESALQQFVAANAATPLQPSSAAGYPFSATTNIRVARLSEQASPIDTVRVFAVTAEPVAGSIGASRTIVTLVRQKTAQPQPLQPQIKGALTLSGDLDVRSNAFTVDGRSSDCLATGLGVQAVRKSADAGLQGSGAAGTGFTGVTDAGSLTQGSAAIEATTLDRWALTREALGLAADGWLEDVITQIPPEHRYGPRFRSPDDTVRQFSGSMPSGETVAVIDANGGTVELQSGSSLLIIVNGDLRMRGNARFDGLLVVEGGFSLQGSAAVNGALISLGLESGEGVIGGEATTAGGVTIRYDQCAVDRAKQAYNNGLGVQPVVTTGETFAWFEAVR